MMQKDKLDFYFKSEPINFNLPPEIRFLKNPSTQPIHFCYSANVTQKEARVEDWLKQLPNSFVFYFSTLAIAIVLIITLEAWMFHFLKQSLFAKLFTTLHRRYFYFCGMIIGNSPPRLQLISLRLSLSFFMFLCCYRLLNIIITGSIKTNLVLLDQSDISNDVQYLIKTNRQPCWVTGEQYLTHFSNASPGSVFRQLWDWKSKKKCFVDKEVQSLIKVAKIYSNSFIADKVYM